MSSFHNLKPMDIQGQRQVFVLFFAGFRVARSAVKMVSKDAVNEQFGNFGIDVTDDVLDKCVELCSSYSIDGERLVEAWLAFCVSTSAAENPTLDALRQMERSQLREEIKGTPPTQIPAKTSNLIIYNAATVDEPLDDDILSAYSATPKTKSKIFRKQNTPDQHRSPRSIFSPASFSPNVSTPSQKYEGRSNSGSAVCSFGNIENAQWFVESSYIPTIKAEVSVPHNSLYMFDTLRERSSLLEMNLECVKKTILAKVQVEELQPVFGVCLDDFIGYGRICIASNSNRLKLDTVMLESPEETDQYRFISMDLSSVPNLSVFPGQIVLVKAVNPSRTHLLVREIFCDGSLSLPRKPSFSINNGSLQIVIAAGPFTQLDTMTYQPLEDLVENLKSSKPHVVILIGPFIDAEHPHVKDGLLAETFDTFFEKQVENIMSALYGSSTQVILVASSRDVHHHLVYPTPAYSLSKQYPNLHVMGDPCIANIDGLMVGITSVDVLKHIGNEELASSVHGQDRLGRLAKHILMQSNFYPLYPPSGQISLDTKLWYDYCHLPFTPHILVLPSDLHSFIKEVLGCVVVNPERLAKGLAGGSFVRLEVDPIAESWNTSCVRGQVLKI